MPAQLTGGSESPATALLSKSKMSNFSAKFHITLFVSPRNGTRKGDLLYVSEGVILNEKVYQKTWNNLPIDT